MASNNREFVGTEKIEALESLTAIVRSLGLLRSRIANSL